MGMFDYLHCTCTECGKQLEIQTKLLPSHERDLRHYEVGHHLPCGRNGLVILKERCPECHFHIGMLIDHDTILQFFTITNLMVERSGGSIDLIAMMETSNKI